MVCHEQCNCPCPDRAGRGLHKLRRLRLQSHEVCDRIRVALEAIDGDVSSFAATNEKVNLSACHTMLRNVVHPTFRRKALWLQSS